MSSIRVVLNGTEDDWVDCTTTVKCTFNDGTSKVVLTARRTEMDYMEALTKTVTLSSVLTATQINNLKSITCTADFYNDGDNTFNYSTVYMTSQTCSWQ